MSTCDSHERIPCDACDRGTVTERRATTSGPYIVITRPCALCGGRGWTSAPGEARPGGEQQ